MDPIDKTDNYTCPHRLSYQAPFEVRKIFQYYRGYQDGFLPFEGALTDQPNNLVEAFGEISSVRAVLDKEDTEDNSGNGNDNSNSGFKSVLPGK